MSSYYNKTTNDGSYGTFYADPGQADINIYARVKFAAFAASDGQPFLQVCTASDIGIGVAMQTITAGQWGTIKFRNAPGTQLGNATTTMAAADALYPDNAGGVTNVAGTQILGYCVTPPASATGIVVYCKT
jgi:hypothetical protein